MNTLTGKNIDRIASNNKRSTPDGKDIKHNLDDYLKVVIRVHAEIRRDPDAYAQFKALTGRGNDHTIPDRG